MTRCNPGPRLCSLRVQDGRAEWVRAELARVRGAFAAVYTNQNAGDFFLYLEHLRGIRFRDCLVTASDALPPHCRCPHLTKYVFGLWLAGGWTREDLRRRQLALLVELFHRAQQPLAWHCQPAHQPRAWLTARAPLDLGAALQHLTLGQARRARLAEVTRALDAAPRGDLVGEVLLDTEAVYGAQHFQVGSAFISLLILPMPNCQSPPPPPQFSLLSVGAMFQGLAAAGSVAGFSADLSQLRLAGLLRVAGEVDNLRRAMDPRYSRAMDTDEFLRRGSKTALAGFRGAVLRIACEELDAAYPPAMAAAHGSPLATTFPPEHVAQFRLRHGVDLEAVYGLTPAGLPTVACCLPGCPHYLRPLGPPRPGKRLHARLRDHLSPVAVVPALHKTVQSLRELQSFERADADDVQACARVIAEMVGAGAWPASCLLVQIEAHPPAHSARRHNVRPQPGLGHHGAVQLPRHAVVAQHAGQHLAQPRHPRQPAAAERAHLRQAGLDLRVAHLLHVRARRPRRIK